MKNNPVLPVLVGLICLSALATAFLTARYYFGVRHVRRLQQQAAQIQRVQGQINLLRIEAEKYGEKNPAILNIINRYKP